MRLPDDIVAVKDEEGYELVFAPDGTPIGWVSPLFDWDDAALQEDSKDESV